MSMLKSLPKLTNKSLFDQLLIFSFIIRNPHSMHLRCDIVLKV
jgi:hypothetical protein